MKPTVPVTPVMLTDARTGEYARFHLVFYGLRSEDFMGVPGGSEPIHIALREQGLGSDGYVCSPFHVGRTR